MHLLKKDLKYSNLIFRWIEMTPLLSILCALLATSTEAVGINSKSPVVLWYAPFLSGGGYCSEAHSYVVALDTVTTGTMDSGLNIDSQVERKDREDSVLSERAFELLITQHGDSLNPSFIRDIPNDMKTKLEQHWIDEKDFSWRLQDRKVVLAICHSEPGAWDPAHYRTSRCPPHEALYKVGRTMFETDRVPRGWSERMNKMDEIWVPTKFQEKIFIHGGVRPEAVKVVPEVVDVAFFNPQVVEQKYHLQSQVTFDMTDQTTVYLSIFKWEERKAWKVLLTAYFEAFSAKDDVVLVLLTNGYHSTSSTATDFMDVIENFALQTLNKPLHELPHVHVLPPHIPQKSMPALYKAANAFVLPSRGEGWGRPHVEAMAMELPVIATFWSGTTEYMTEENSYPLAIDGLVKITEGAFQGHLWANPSVKHLKELLMRVKEYPEEAIAKGKQARKDMVSNYSPEIVGGIVYRHIMRIMENVSAQEGATATDAHEEL